MPKSKIQREATKGVGNRKGASQSLNGMGCQQRAQGLGFPI